MALPVHIVEQIIKDAGAERVRENAICDLARALKDINCLVG
jgi:histone H3/H4